MRILLFAALPQEHGSFRRRSRPWRLPARRPFRLFSGVASGAELLLVETGMGARRAREAMEWACGQFPPDLILSIGFAGSLCEDLNVGDVLLGVESVHYLRGKCASPGEEFVLNVPEDLKECLKRLGVSSGRIVTVEEPQAKADMAALFSDVPTVMDMETHVAASFAEEAGVPLLCLRSVSDGLHDEIDYDVGTISDSEGNVRIGRVIGALLRRPRLLTSFAHSWLRATKAAEGLGRSLCGFLDLPPSTLSRGTAGCLVGIRACKRDGDG